MRSGGMLRIFDNGLIKGGVKQHARCGAEIFRLLEYSGKPI
jgi:hypothetical protein